MLLTRLRLLLPEEEEVWFLCPLFPPYFFQGSHLFCLLVRTLPRKWRFSGATRVMPDAIRSCHDSAKDQKRRRRQWGSDDRRRRREGIANDLFKRATHFHRPSLAVSKSVARQKGAEQSSFCKEGRSRQQRRGHCSALCQPKCVL